MAHNDDAMQNLLATFEAWNGLAVPRFPEVPADVLKEYTDSVYPLGSWAVDFAEFEGMDALTRKLARDGSAEFVVTQDGPNRFAIREASPVRPIPADVESATYGEYPVTPERGPLGRWDAGEEVLFLRRFLFSRSDLCAGRCFRVVRTGRQTLIWAE